MLEVLAYLYETYYRPETFPETATLTKTLSDIGFKETEIADALVWLDHLAETSETFAERHPERGGFSRALRHLRPPGDRHPWPRSHRLYPLLETVGILDPVLARNRNRTLSCLWHLPDANRTTSSCRFVHFVEPGRGYRHRLATPSLYRHGCSGRGSVALNPTGFPFLHHICKRALADSALTRLSLAAI